MSRKSGDRDRIGAQAFAVVFALVFASGFVSCEKPKLRSDLAAEEEGSSATPETQLPGSPLAPPPKMPQKRSVAGSDPAERARAIAHHQARLDAQLAGIRSLESDFSRHSLQLEALRGELRAIRARQASQRSGGIRVERIDGQSTLVDRGREAAELEARIRAEEQIVAQLGPSLEAARAQHRELAREFDRLWTD